MTRARADETTWLDGERLIRFARGALEEAPALLEARGFEGFALLTSARVRARAGTLEDHAAVTCEVPGGRVGAAAAAVLDRVGSRPVVAIGGGRVIDSAKAVAAAGRLACAALPTTLSGAEMTGFHRLPAGVEGARLVRPSLVVADPGLMASQPVVELAASAMNGLAHAVEALYTPLANPVATMAALRAAELFATGLAGTEPCRPELAMAALLAGYASGQTGFAVHHVVCQTIVGMGGTPHAQTNAIVLPHSVALMVDRAAEQIGRLALALGATEPDPALAPELVARLVARTGLDGLTALGFDAASVDAAVDAALVRAELQNTPNPPGRDELHRMVDAAL